MERFEKYKKGDSNYDWVFGRFHKTVAETHSSPFGVDGRKATTPLVKQYFLISERITIFAT